MDLESELRTIEVAWPPTPAFVLTPRRRRRPAVAALAAAAVAAAAVAAAFAVPQSRGAILRFLHLGGAEIRFVDTLPAAERRPLAEGLGPVVPLETARAIVRDLLLPPLTPPPAPRLQPGDVVSFVFRHEGRPVLLSELPSAEGVFLKKLLGGATRADRVRVGDADGFWLSGAPHVVGYPRRSPRLAGNVLIWASEAVTYRLEGPGLGKDDAIRLARSLRRG